MEIIKTIKKRRSIRSFQNKKVSADKIARLLEAARWAPSAGNLQDWFFVVVKNQETKEKLSKAAFNQSFVSQAPVVIVSCADLPRISSRYGDRGRNLYTLQDTALATYNIWLTAAEMGLGAVWVGAFSEKQVSEILELPSHLRPVALLPLGYPDKLPSAPSRRKKEEISKII